MSSDESSDGLEELKQLMTVYAKQEEQTEQKPATSYVEVPLEKAVFGDRQRFLANLAKSVGHKWKGETAAEEQQQPEETSSTNKRKPAWSDSDDEDLQVGDVKRPNRHSHLRKDKSYKQYLTARFERSQNGQPKWAEKPQKATDHDSDSSADEPLLRTVGFIDHKAKNRELRPKILHFKRVKDLNRATTYSEAIINSVQFHPTSTAALVAGHNGLATIYAVDGHKNEKLHQIKFKDFGLKCARIAPDGTKAFFSSFRPYYYAYDLIQAKALKLTLPQAIQGFSLFEISPCGKYLAATGKFGAINLFTTHTNELMGRYKQEGLVRSMCWTGDSKRLICCGSSSQIYVLSLRQRRIEHKFSDDGCIRGQSVELAPNQRLLATGSQEGVVNVYDYETAMSAKAPKPEKRFLNLTTSITDLKFNHSSELLAMSSVEAPNSLKLAHFPTATIYANFPGQQEQVGYVKDLAFSPSGGYLAMGTQGKRAPLFRLKYFKNY